MIKHTQTICRQFADKLSVFDHFVGLALKGLKCGNVRLYVIDIGMHDFSGDCGLFNKLDLSRWPALSVWVVMVFSLYALWKNYL